MWTLTTFNSNNIYILHTFLKVLYTFFLALTTNECIIYVYTDDDDEEEEEIVYKEEMESIRIIIVGFHNERERKRYIVTHHSDQILYRIVVLMSMFLFDGNLVHVCGIWESLIAVAVALWTVVQ